MPVPRLLGRTYERQLEIKTAIIEDTVRRLGRITLEARPPIAGSPADGYRMRARLHVRNRKIGFVATRQE